MKQNACQFQIIKETWKDINGYNGEYQVSNKGRIKTLQKWKKIPEESIMKLKKYSNGYSRIDLCKKW